MKYILSDAELKDVMDGLVATFHGHPYLLEPGNAPDLHASLQFCAAMRADWTSFVLVLNAVLAPTCPAAEDFTAEFYGADDMSRHLYANYPLWCAWYDAADFTDNQF